MKIKTLLPFLMTSAIITGCNDTNVRSSTDTREVVRIESILQSPEDFIEQEHQDRIARIQRLALANNVPLPSVDEQLILPKEVFGTKIDLPVVRLAWSDKAFFDTDVDTPVASSEPIIQMLAQAIKSDLPDTHIQVVGHTDARGSEEYNYDLSKRRARNVTNRLIELGVRPEQISYIAAGKLQPIASNMTSEGMAQNRRVEFILGAYSELTLEAVSRIPFNEEHKRLPTTRVDQRLLQEEQKIRSVSVYSGERKTNSSTSNRSVNNEQTERSENVQSISREIQLIGSHERALNLPPVTVRAPVIRDRASGI